MKAKDKIGEMSIGELRADIKNICKAFGLGNLVGFKTEKNSPADGYNTAFFRVEKSNEEYKYYYTNTL